MGAPIPWRAPILSPSDLVVGLKTSFMEVVVGVQLRDFRLPFFAAADTVLVSLPI